MKITKPKAKVDGATDLEWAISTLKELMYESALAPNDKDLANVVSKFSYAISCMSNVFRQQKDYAEFEELKKQVNHILSVKNRDAVK